jgi:hypothetical protein
MNMMQPSVKLKIMLVILFVSRWADRFFPIKIFIDFLSKKSNSWMKTSSTILYRLNAIKVRPRIMPNKIEKNIDNIRPRFNEITAVGST